MTVGPTENRREWESSTPERNAELIAAANKNIAVLQSLASGEISDVEAAGLMTSFEAKPAEEKKGTGSSSKANPTTYNKKASDALLEKELLDALNIVPDAKTKAEFFKGLNAFLKAYGSTSGSKSSGTGASTSYSIQGADATAYVSQFIKEIIKDKLKKNPKAELGGSVGDNIRALTNYAANMGVFKSINEIVSKSADIVTGATRQEDVLASYRKDAQALYVNFAPRLKEDASLTVRDLANPYIEMMADTFEGVASNIKLTDDTLQKAINDAKGLMNLGEFRTMLRRDQRFNVTSTAKQEAASLATGMLRSMKFGA